MIFRNLAHEIQNYIQDKGAHKPVCILEGVRQTGKTTVIKQALANFDSLYIDLEKSKSFRAKLDRCEEFFEFENLLKDEFGFVPNKGKILVIDEAQESRRLGSFVRYLKEDWEKQSSILSGSLMSRLFRDGIREPVGRTKKLVLRPYSFKEFLKAHDKEHLVKEIEAWHPKNTFSQNRHEHLIELFQTYLQVGGLPEVNELHANGKDWQDHLLQLKVQYEDDFIRVFGDSKLSLYQRILKRVAETIGYPSKKATIVATNQQAYRELDDLLSQVQRWHLVLKVGQESYMPTKSGKLIPKRYLFDVGMAQLLGRQARPQVDLLSDASSEVRTPLGGLIENAVLCELKVLNAEVNGWRYKTNGSEVDFVAQKNQSIYPVEVKSSRRFRKNFLKPLLNYMDLYGLKEGFLVDLMPGSNQKINDKVIYQIPVYCVSEVFRLAATD